jgi:TBC1 domain family protein 5
MHELLAVCFWVLDRDSLSPPDKDVLKSPLARDTIDEAMQATLDRRYVEHDAFGLYNEIMRSAKPFYEWRAEEVPVSTPLAPSYIALGSLMT